MIEEGNAIAEESATVPRDPAEPESISTRSAGGPWREKPAAPWVVVALVGIIVVVPAWILKDDLRNFTLIGDDFAYVSESRDWPTTCAHLLEPHNTHIVPIFRLWTFVLVTLARRLEYMPMVEAAASYLGLIAAMIAVGHLVAKREETGADGRKVVCDGHRGNLHRDSSIGNLVFGRPGPLGGDRDRCDACVRAELVRKGGRGAVRRRCPRSDPVASHLVRRAGRRSGGVGLPSL